MQKKYVSVNAEVDTDGVIRPLHYSEEEQRAGQTPDCLCRSGRRRTA